MVAWLSTRVFQRAPKGTAEAIWNNIANDPGKAAANLGVNLLFGAGMMAGKGPSRASARTNAQLVQEVATRAEAWGVRKGLTGTPHKIGTAKHTYARDLLRRYQSMYGDRGLVTESSWLGGNPATYGAKGSVRLDVYERATGTVWDYKFGITPISAAQRAKIIMQGPRGITSITEVHP